MYHEEKLEHNSKKPHRIQIPRDIKLYQKLGKNLYLIILYSMWELIIINEDDKGYLVQAPNGDTHWMSKQDYQKYLEKINKN